jgi:hypothetical protein
MLQQYRSAVRQCVTALLLAIGLLAPAVASAQNTRWVFAEGAYGLGGFFREEIAVANPSAAPVSVSLTLLTPSGNCALPNLTALTPTSTYNYDIGGVIGGFCPQLPKQGQVSVVVDASAPVVAERTIYLGGRGMTSATHEVGFNGPPSPIWYFAEGSSGSVFQTYFLLANIGGTAANVTIEYLKDGGVVTGTTVVPAGGRATVRAPDQLGGFGARITSDQPIYAERAMYWNGLKGSHASAGIRQPMSTWHFAEGVTFPGFHTFLLLANPNTDAITVNVTYHLDGGGVPMTASYTVPGLGRTTVAVGAAGHGGPGNAAFSMTATTGAGGPAFVAERAIYWNGFSEGTASPGLPAPATQWGFADGSAGGFAEFQRAGEDWRLFNTWFLLANNTGATANVTGYFYREDGTGITAAYQIPANSRKSIPANDPRISHQRFAAFFVSDQPIVAEKATYYGAGWIGAFASAGVPWNGMPVAAPAAAPPAPTIPNHHLGRVSRAGGQLIALTGANLTDDIRVFLRKADGSYAPMESFVVNQGLMYVKTLPSTASGFHTVALRTNGSAVDNYHVGLEYGTPGAANGPTVATYPATRHFPINYLSVVQALARRRPDLWATMVSASDDACAAKARGDIRFMAALVEDLRNVTGSNRWGLNEKRGAQGPSFDVLAYYWGPEDVTMEGDTRVYLIDIAVAGCSPAARPGWGTDTTDKTYAGVFPGPCALCTGRWRTFGFTFTIE